MKIGSILFLLIILASCEKLSKTDYASESNPYKETLIRKQQRVIRYNCKGEIRSDKIETINSVSRIYTLEPKETKNLYDFDAVNKTTNSKAGRLGAFNQGIFTLDLAPTIFNIKAIEGVNEIAWSFYYCSKLNSDKRCIGNPELKESGTLYIEFKQEVQFINEISEIRPTKEECAPVSLK